MAKKSDRREYNPNMRDIMPKRMGGYEAGRMANGEMSVQTPNALYSQQINRVSNVSNGYADVIASNFAFDDDLEKDSLTTKLAGEESVNPAALKKLGFVLYGRYGDVEQAESMKVLAERKEGKKIHIYAGQNSDGQFYDLWIHRYSESDNMKFSKVASPDMSEKKVAFKKATYKLKQGMTKIAFDRATQLGIINSMTDCGFNMYKEAGAGDDPDGIWWKEKEVDPSTGEAKYYLVKQKGVIKARNVDNKKVEPVIGKEDVDKKQKKASIEMKKIAHKVILKTAKEDKDDSADTAAVSHSDVPAKVVNLQFDSWKDEVVQYVRKCKEKGMKPKKMEVKIIDWVAEDV